jgi:hypothetical protein
VDQLARRPVLGIDHHNLIAAAAPFQTGGIFPAGTFNQHLNHLPNEPLDPFRRDPIHFLQQPTVAFLNDALR